MNKIAFALITIVLLLSATMLLGISRFQDASAAKETSCNNSPSSDGDVWIRTCCEYDRDAKTGEISNVRCFSNVCPGKGEEGCAPSAPRETGELDPDKFNELLENTTNGPKADLLEEDLFEDEDATNGDDITKPPKDLDDGSRIIDPEFP